VSPDEIAMEVSPRAAATPLICRTLYDGSGYGALAPGRRSALAPGRRHDVPGKVYGQPPSWPLSP
jgi:hypothetical protein